MARIIDPKAPAVSACTPADDGTIAGHSNATPDNSRPMGTQANPACSDQTSGSARVRYPPQRASRTVIATPPPSNSPPLTTASVPTTQAPSPTAASASAIPSITPNDAGNRVSPRLASQLRVKAGTTRPPIRPISMVTTAMPSRQPYSPSIASSVTSAWIMALAASSPDSATGIGRLRQFRPAKISRSTNAIRDARKARSQTAATPLPIRSENATAPRPSTQIANNIISGAPCSGLRPVQFGIAVNRKPAIAAATKPNSISCTCQETGSNAVGNAIVPSKTGSHSSIDSAPQNPAAKKNGRKPWSNIAAPANCHSGVAPFAAGVMRPAPCPGTGSEYR